LPFWDFLRKQEDVAVAVPLNYDVGQATYPEASFESFATEGYAKSEIVHACIRELAVSAASPRYYVQAPAQGGGAVEITSGLLHDLTSKPNPTSDWYSFVETLVTYLMVAGNTYTLKERNRSGKVAALYHLRPDRVRIIGGDHGAEGYVYTVGGKDYSIPREDICHMALPNPGGDLYGLSPLQVLARNVNLDLNMTDFAKVYFQNAGVPSGLLKLKRRLNTQEEASVIRARWRSQFGGRANFHRVAILDEDADYVPMANAPKDMALPELHNLTESRICAVFGVPAILVGANVGLQRSTYSNYREARLAFHSETLEPMISRVLRHFNRNMFEEYAGNETLTVDWAEMRSGLDDREAMTSRVTGLFAGGIVTLNEAREQLGLQAVTDGAIRRIPAAIFEVAEGTPAPVAVGAAPVEESLPVGTFKESSPALKAPRVARRAGMLRRQLLEDREEETDQMAKRVQRYFRGLRNRVDGILGRWMERGGAESKDFPPDFNPSSLYPEDAISDLQAIIERAMTRMSKKTVAAINANGLAGTLDWSEQLPFIQSVLVQAPTRATMIHSTTNRAISRGVALALERGYSISQLARGVPADQFPGLRSILTETENRSRLIARTEIMRTQNLTSVGFYKEQGFAYVRADDVDGDPDDDYVDPGDPYGRTCAERNGQIYTVEDAQNIDDHPNGTLNWQPMPRNYKPEETA
jgi:HK97 family phage portal protein